MLDTTIAELIYQLLDSKAKSDSRIYNFEQRVEFYSVEAKTFRNRIRELENELATYKEADK